MMIDIAQVQPGFELQTLVPATTLVMFTLGGFELRNRGANVGKLDNVGFGSFGEGPEFREGVP